LHQDPRIPEKTRQRVERAAKELDYRPNSLMSEIASSHWQRAKVAKGSMIAFIDCSRPEDHLGLAFGPTIREQALSLGYHLEIFRRWEFASSAKLQKDLRNRGITDLILGPVFEKSLIVELGWSKFITVQLCPSGIFPLPLHSVVKNHYNRITLAWQQAVNHGYERIGITLVDHPTRLEDDVSRASAVYACQRHLFPHLPALPPYHFGKNLERTVSFKKWLDATRPDVVMGFTDGFHTMLQAAARRKIAFINLHIRKEDPIKFTGIPDLADVYEREGVNLLHFCRRTHQWGIPAQRIDHVVEPIWFEGNSLPQRN
jgi:DNA-binding LacI/PurR family transcriptional regulator